jgi:ABC-type Fe3+/spermidine/putrescine transport system ATPase subunit
MLELVDIHKSYEGQPLLAGISFSVSPGETVCLLGPSGSGKSTLLRLVAGLEQPERGLVRWGGEDLASTPAHRRNFGLVFQDYALFPHLDVAANIAFGLRMQNLPADEIKLRIANLLEKINLNGFEKRRVTDLSGGEQQRVALARALAPGPRLLMFDEPLGALDRALKDTLLDELRRILHETGVPAIYVTHDQEEAFALADRILLLHEGCIIQSGPPAEVVAHPVSVWAARFLGAGNLLTGEIVRRSGSGWEVLTEMGRVTVNCGQAHTGGEKVNLLVNRYQVREAAEGNLLGVVADVLFQQNGFKVTLENGLFFYLDEAPEVGAAIRLEARPSSVQCLP